MAKLTEAEKIARYDAERSGAIYTKIEKDALTPEWFERHIAEDEDRIKERVLQAELERRRVAKPACSTCGDDGDCMDCGKPGADTVWAGILDITDDPTDDGLSDAEARCLDILYPDVVIVPSRDAAHREERLIDIMERIAALPEPRQSELIGYTLGVLDAMTGNRQ